MPEKCLAIGVTGHRYLTDESTIRNGVREALARIACKFPSTCVSAVSPIAEGADRLVAKEILAAYTGGLIAVLPFPIQEYLLDFESAESKTEFQKLIAIAKEVIVIPQSEDRNENYNNVGRTMRPGHNQAIGSRNLLLLEFWWFVYSGFRIIYLACEQFLAILAWFCLDCGMFVCYIGCSRQMGMIFCML